MPNEAIITTKGYELAHMEMPNYSVGPTLEITEKIPRKKMIPRAYQRSLLSDYVSAMGDSKTVESDESKSSDHQPILGLPKIEMPIAGLKDDVKISPKITIVDCYILYSPSENSKDLRVELYDKIMQIKHNMSMEVARKNMFEML